MLPFLNLGPLALPTGPLVYLLGVWLALFAVDRAARRLRLDAERHYALATTAVLAGFIGARLVFVLLHWSSYDDNLLGIVWPLTTGYSAIGGGPLRGAAGRFFPPRRRVGPPAAPAAPAPGLLVFLIAVSLADFLGGAGYGSLTSMPWGVTVFGVRRHAVQLYEALAGVVALGVWWAATSDLTGLPRPVRSNRAGRPFLWATAAYAGGRLLVDAYRENAALVSGFHVTQIVALVVLLLALGLAARAAAR